MAYSDNVQAITQNRLMPKAVNQIVDSNIVGFRFMGNAEKWQGIKIEKPVIITKQSNGKFFDGSDTFNTNDPQTKIKLAFSVKAFEMPVVLDQIEADLNASDDRRALLLIAGKIEEALDAAFDDIAAALLGDGTGSSGKAMMGLEGIVDDGGEVATYGEQSRSTYTSLKASEYDLSELTLAGIAAADSAARHGTDRVTLHLTSDTQFDKYETFLNASVVANINADGYRQLTRTGVTSSMAALGGNLGFDALYFRGKPLVAEQKCDDGDWFGLNERYIKFYGLKSTDPDYTPINVGGNKTMEGGNADVPSKNVGFSWSGLKSPDNQYAKIGHLICMGNLVCTKPNTNFKINVS